MRDTIVEEVRQFRVEHAKRFANDLDAIFDDFRRHQATWGRRLVRLPPRRIGTARVTAPPEAKGSA
jgi:hypothetical protein